MKTKILMPIIGFFLIQTLLYSSNNESFIEVMAKNRASSKANHTNINSKEEFLKSINKEKSDKKNKRSSITKEYIYTEIKNVNIKKSDLKHIKEDTLHLGSDAEGGKVVQLINIKNSRIKTDKQIDLSLHTTTDNTKSLTSITNIKKSKIIGKESRKKKKNSKKSFMDKSSTFMP